VHNGETYLLHLHTTGQCAGKYITYARSLAVRHLQQRKSVDEHT